MKPRAFPPAGPLSSACFGLRRPGATFSFPMRVLLVSSSSGSRGGGEIFLLYLAEALVEAGVEPLLWCADHPRMDELAERFSAHGEVIRAAYPNSYHDRRLRVLGATLDRGLSRRLGGQWRDSGADLIHLNKQTLEDGLDLLAAARRSGLPTLATVHITQSNRALGAVAAGPRDWLSRRALRRAAEVPLTAVSDRRGADLERFSGRPAEVIYNAVSDQAAVDRATARAAIMAAHGWPGDGLLAVCLARLVPQKDPPRFLRLAAKLHAADPRWRFLWIGDGDLRETFFAEAEALGLGSCVACAGWVAAPRGRLAAADLYLHPAAYEGLPLAILEAMCAGLPCALSPAIAAEARPFDERSVIVCDEEDDAWVGRATREDSRAAFARASRRLYEEHFRPRAMARAFIRLYRKTVAAHR